jgi:carbon storage regulator
MLILTRKSHEQIQIGDNITITILRMKGKGVQVGIDAPRDMTVLRKELCFRQASASAADNAEESSDAAEIAEISDEMPVAVAAQRKAARPLGGKRQTTARIASAHPLRAPVSAVATSPLMRYLAHR